MKDRPNSALPAYGRASILVAVAIATTTCASVPKTPPPGQPAQQQKPVEPVEAAPVARPNIIFILADDMDMTHVQYMPHLRSHMASKGMTFTNMFVTTPVCAPSRASILTGQYAHNHQLRDGGRVTGGYREFLNAGREKSTLGTWLQAAGYRTALHGKYLNFYPLVRDRQHVPPGWDDWRGVCFPEQYYDYTLNENGRLVSYGAEQGDYLTDVLRQSALDFIASTPKEQPFYLHLTPYAPHAAVVPAERHAARFLDLKAPRPPSYNEQDVSDKPRWVQALPLMTPEVMEATDEAFRKRVQSLQAVDEMIEALVRALEGQGRLENTFIFFTSDNGFHFGAHRMDHGKGDPYQESIHVPLVVRGPGVRAGQSVDALALNIDLAPTIAALARAEAPESVDGRSLAPILTGGTAASDWRTDVLAEANYGEGAGITGYRALRTKDAYYVEYATGERELYDLAKDPYELQSLHASADPALLASYSARLAALKTCAGDSCRR